MNGDALMKRYEIRDAETGEVVEDAYVLRPKEDWFSWIVMHAYAVLSGLDNPTARLVADGSDWQGQELWREAVESRMDPAEDCESFSGEQILSLSTIGSGGDGSAERAVTLMKSLGYEPVSVICRKTSDEEADEASRQLDAVEDTHLRRLRTAGQTTARIEGPDERGVFPSSWPEESRRKHELWRQERAKSVQGIET